MKIRAGGMLPAFVLAGSLLTGCTTGTSDALPSAKKLASARPVVLAETEIDLRRGRALLVTECTSCHRFFEPRELSVREWENVLPDMLRRTPVSKRQGRELVAYVLEAARYAEERNEDPPTLP